MIVFATLDKNPLKTSDFIEKTLNFKYNSHWNS